MSKTAAAAPEPSMEDILASIRKIITDEEPATPAVHPAEPEIDEMAAAMAIPQNQEIDEMAAAMAEPEIQTADEDVFELTGEMASAPEPQAPKIQPDDDEDICFAEEEEPKSTPVIQMEHVPVFTPQPSPVIQTPVYKDPPSIISPDVTQTISAQFSDLTNLMFSQNTRTIEDLIQDMMKPMLKGWLDQNLPNLVERIVREEIERVTRGRR